MAHQFGTFSRLSPFEAIVVVSAVLVLCSRHAQAQSSINDIEPVRSKSVAMRYYMLTRTAAKLGVDTSGAEQLLTTSLRRRYGDQCGQRVGRQLVTALGCLLQFLVPADVGLAALIAAARAGNAVTHLCRMADFDGMFQCTQQLANTSTGSTKTALPMGMAAAAASAAASSCTGDDMLQREAHSMAAVVRAMRRLCDQDGEPLSRAMRQLQTCPAPGYRNFTSRLQQCSDTFNRLTAPERGGTAAGGFFSDSLAAMQNASQGCPALVSVAQCVPPALAHCSPLLRDMTTDAFSQVVFTGVCSRHLESAAVQDVLDNYGREHYITSALLARTSSASLFQFSGVRLYSALLFITTLLKWQLVC